MPIKTNVKLLIMFIIILITSISYKNSVAVSQLSTVKIKPKIKIALEFANNYKNIDELIAVSDVVVFGKFTGNPQIVLPSKGLLPLSWKQNTQRRPLDPAIINQILTSREPGHRTMTFIPTQIFKGSTSKAITVGQRGVFTEAKNAPNKGDRFFQAGDAYVLFLTLEPSRSDNFYWTTGAVQGAFQVKSDRVNFSQIKSESLDNFLQTIQANVNLANSN